MAKLSASLTCQKDCQLWFECKTPKVASEGDFTTAEIVFIGEAPGGEEDIQNRPFVGEAGLLLREAISSIGIKNYAITNAVKCRPPNNRTPTTREIRTCAPFLEQELQSMPKLKLIVALGNVPLTALCGIKSGIVKYSGKTLTCGGRLILPIMHPAYFLRHQDELSIFFEHMRRIPNALTGTLVDPADRGTYTTISTLDDWHALYDILLNAKQFAFDIESTSLSPESDMADIKCIGFSWEPRKASVLITNYQTTQARLHSWTEEEWFHVLAELRTLFESPDIGKIGHNAKFDILWLRRIYKIETRGLIWDTKIAQALLNENESNNLKDLAWKFSKLGNYADELLDSVEKVDGESLYLYNAIDTDLTYRIYQAQYPVLTADCQLYTLFSKILLPASIVLSEMEETGVLIDQDLVQESISLVDAKLEELVAKIRKEAAVVEYEKDTGEVFNPNSHTQLQEVLFKYENLPILKRTAQSKKPSTDLSVLEKLSAGSNLCKLLVTYSQYQTTRSKTLKEFTTAVQPDGRIHTTYWLTETATGRSSSRRPNLQNLPKGKKDLVKIRRAVVADPDYFFVEFDYNQIELRLAAFISGDKELERALAGDVHRKTAANILGIPESAVTDEQRRLLGKATNFGVLYGQTKWGLMKHIGCSEVEAERYLAKFFEAYPMLSKYMENVKRQIFTVGYVRSPLGRYRRLPIWKYADPESPVVAALVREAINAPIQSLASDLLLISLVEIRDFLRQNHYKSKLVLEIHDAVILLIHQTELQLVEKIKEIMTTAFKKFIDIPIPITVNVSYGTSLGNMVEL